MRTEPVYRDGGVIDRHNRSVIAALKILDAHLADRAFVAADRLTMADIPLGPVVHRYFGLEVERPDFPNLSAWYARLGERPAFREHAMFPCGGKPAEWYRLEVESGYPTGVAEKA